MKDYIEGRMNEHRQRYKETNDEQWQHRFNECKAILERYELEQINSTQGARPSEGRVYDPFSLYTSSTQSNR
jgi:hypothetical protein